MIKRKIKPIKEKPKVCCIYCDEIFEAQRKQAVYCSNTCIQYYHYFRIQFPSSSIVPAQISLYKMQFMPVYLETNYSKKLHDWFAQSDGIVVRNWIHLQRVEADAEKLLQTNLS